MVASIQFLVLFDFVLILVHGGLDLVLFLFDLIWSMPSIYSLVAIYDFKLQDLMYVLLDFGKTKNWKNGDINAKSRRSRRLARLAVFYWIWDMNAKHRSSRLAHPYAIGFDSRAVCNRVGQ